MAARDDRRDRRPGSGAASRPPARATPRRRGPRKVTLALALALTALGFAAGLLAGMGLRGNADSRTTTVDQTVRVVTVAPGR